MREGVLRSGLVVAGVVAGLVTVELGLWVASAIAPYAFARVSTRMHEGNLRIACVGDSHVYGAFVAPRDAFPEQLDEFLRRAHVPADVYNFGIPGQNSFQVSQRLPRILERYRPDVVIVLVGHNNYWNLSEREVTAPTASRPWSWRDLRLVRAVHVLRVSLREGAAAARRPELRLLDQGEAGEHLIIDLGDGMETVDMWRGGHELMPDAIERVTRDDLVAIAGLVRGAHAVPVFLDYPVVLRPERAAAQRAIQRAAQDANVLCLDTNVLTSRLQRRGDHGLFFSDLHPTGRFYRPMAWALARQLVRRGVVPRAGRPHDGLGGHPATGCEPLV